MKKFERFGPSNMTPTQKEELILHTIKTFGGSREQVERAMVKDLEENCIRVKNDIYVVAMRQVHEPICDMIWLSICRIDKKPLHNWRDLQTIKNMLVGENCFGYEVYPAEDQLVDTANQYHLWCLPNGTHLPFGFHDGRKVSYESTSVTKQEPLNK
jgi:hypothetical protein